MEPTQKNLSFDESVKQVIQSLPQLIRQYIQQGKYTEVAKHFMHTYALRVDQAGVLEKEILLLLMGIDNPDEFVQALAEEAKLDRQTIKSITQDVNDQIFVPLREEMRKGGKAEEQKSAPPPFTSVPKYIPTKKYFNLQNKIPPAQSASPNPPAFSPQPPASRLLEDHEEPHIEFKKSSFAPPNLPGVVEPPPKTTQAEPIKSYSTDPYREPIDDKI